MGSIDDIPTLNVKKLTEKEEELQELAAKLKDAFSNIGFVAITNHNISLESVSTSIQTNVTNTSDMISIVGHD